MIWVGLTGGIASGKSTISRLFRKEGASIIDADEIAHKLIRKGEQAYQPVVASFGTRILDEDGEINRKKLGEIIYSNPEKRRNLNQIVHPLVFERALSERKRIVHQHPKKVLIFEVPLLFETKSDQEMDFILLAYVDLKTQIDRLVRRDHLSRHDALLRIHAQMPLENKVQFSDEVIDTRRPFSEVEETVGQIYKKLGDKA